MLNNNESITRLILSMIENIIYLIIGYKEPKLYGKKKKKHNYR